MGTRTAKGLILLATLALGLRLGAVHLLWFDPARPIAFEHGRIAENLLAGKGFSIRFLGKEGPTSQQAPFYPFLLAAFYWFFGPGTSQALLAVQILQCFVGTTIVLLVVRLAWQLIPDRPEIGWLAGLGAAVYPPHVYMVTHLQVASWAAMLVVATLVVVTSHWAYQSRFGPVAAGLLGGWMLLVDPILALPLGVCAAAMLGRWGRPGRGAEQLAEAAGREDSGNHLPGNSQRRRQPIVRAATMLAVALAVTIPWTVRNWVVHRELVFIKSTFWYAFWQGNNRASWGTDKIPKPTAEILRHEYDGTFAGLNRALWEARHETVYIDDLLLKPGGYAEFAGLSEPERCRLLGRRALRFVKEHPDRYLMLCLRRLQYWLLFDQTNPKAAHWLYRLSTLLWLALGTVGLVLSRRYWRTLWPTYAIFVLLTVFHSLVIVSARFRIPVEPITFLWGAFPVAAWGLRARSAHCRPVQPPAVAHCGPRRTCTFVFRR